MLKLLSLHVIKEMSDHYTLSRIIIPSTVFHKKSVRFIIFNFLTTYLTSPWSVVALYKQEWVHSEK